MLLMPRRFGLFLLYYIVEESIEIKTHKINYFTNISNWLDLVVIGVSKKITIFHNSTDKESCTFSIFRFREDKSSTSFTCRCKSLQS